MSDAAKMPSSAMPKIKGDSLRVTIKVSGSSEERTARLKVPRSSFVASSTADFKSP